MYTSRSAVEAYQICPRYRYNTYHWNGTAGLVPRASSVPLVTGSAVHRGVEHLANRVRIEQEPSIDTAVGLAIEQYEKDVTDAGFSGKGLQTERQQWFTYCEQKALVEALVRAWGMVELPNIVSRYRIVAVEREVTPIEIVPGVWFQAKVDMELQELQSGDYFNYSLKTCSQWNETMEQSYKDDLQGITETWAVEKESEILSNRWSTLTKEVRSIIDSQQYPDKNLFNIADYLNKKQTVAKRLSGIRFCYLVKGVRKKPDYNAEDENALFITYNSLIRGYKNIGPAGINYAHSWFYPNEENKSGKSALGKGWEPFNVWEDPSIGVKGWVEACFQGLIQPNCPNPVKGVVITPTEYFRDEDSITVGVQEVMEQENRIHRSIDFMVINEKYNTDKLNEIFPHYRKSCSFMYGERCSNYALCWQPEVAADPIGSGLYQIRTPHHEAEKESVGQ